MLNKINTISKKMQIIFSASLVVTLFLVILIMFYNILGVFEKNFDEEVGVFKEVMLDKAETLISENQERCLDFSEAPFITELFNDANNTGTTNESGHSPIDQVNGIIVSDISGQSIYTKMDDISIDSISTLQNALSGTTSSSYQIYQSEIYYITSAPVEKDGVIIGAVTLISTLTDDTFVDDLKTMTHGEFTVFIGDKRVSTTVTNSENVRQVGTKMSSAVAEVVLNQKQEYIGQAEVLGKTFRVEYVPIFDNDGNVMFTLFAGKSIETAVENIQIAISFAVGAAIVLAVLMILLLHFINKNIIKKPFEKIVALANNIKDGEIGISNPEAIEISVKSNDEMGRISKTLSDTAYSLQSYMLDINTVLSSISNKNLDISTSQGYSGDFTEIKNALDSIIASMNVIMAKINESSHVLSGHAEQLSNTSMSLSQSSTEQASTVEELSATISQISQQVSSNAVSATEASNYSQEAMREVSHGNEKMNQMLSSMNQINNASLEISKIISTINNIAFQTNLLALNASVEAARAGAAGRGFAVVAEEVRNLAARSADAAKQTNILIQNTIDMVDDGTKIANETATTFNRIIESTQKTTEIVEEIAKASNEQAVAISQINDAIEQVTIAVQNTAASAEESAATSEEMASQALTLKNIVAQFKLKNNK